MESFLIGWPADSRSFHIRIMSSKRNIQDSPHNIHADIKQDYLRIPMGQMRRRWSVQTVQIDKHTKQGEIR